MPYYINSSRCLSTSIHRDSRCLTTSIHRDVSVHQYIDMTHYINSSTSALGGYILFPIQLNRKRYPTIKEINRSLAERLRAPGLLAQRCSRATSSAVFINSDWITMSSGHRKQRRLPQFSLSVQPPITNGSLSQSSTFWGSLGDDCSIASSMLLPPNDGDTSKQGEPVKHSRHNVNLDRYTSAVFQRAADEDRFDMSIFSHYRLTKM